jgi:CDP-diacylglycerol--glycerol-3-phosphate 3-phosphatidyltransferase
MSNIRYLPNLLTLFRIVMIPVLVVFYYLPWGHVTSPTVFAIACITDWFDGYIARRYNASSRLGAFLDPVADKLIVTVSLVVVMSSHLPYLAIPVAVIIGREIVISALREWMAELGKRASVAVNFIAKIKTTLQMFAIGFLLASSFQGPRWIFHTAYILIYLAAILTLWTMCVYLKASWTYFKESL